jgi:hypothetical protein
MKKFVHLNEQKQNENEKLKDDLLQLTNQLVSFSRIYLTISFIDIIKLEKEKENFRQLLEDDQQNPILQAQNQKLTLLLDRSNVLNGQLIEIRILKSKLGISSTNSICRCDVLNLLPNQQYSTQQNVTSAYLKRVVIQYLTRRDSDRFHLAHLILELVSCTQQQITAVICQMGRSNNLTSNIFT